MGLELCFEPASARAAGKEGLDCIRQIISQAREHLNPEGWLMLEHGYTQAEQVAELMTNADLCSVISMTDLSGTLRVTSGTKDR